MPTPSRFCAKCHYELLGLPPTGRCPECGNPYSAIEGTGLVRDSDGLGSQGRLHRLRTIALLLLAAMALACGGALSLAANNWKAAIGIGAFVAFVLLLGALTSKVYEKD